MSSPLRDEELEATLRDLGARLAYPMPTRLADAVRARLGAPRPMRAGWRALVPALVTAAFLLLVVAAGVPGARATAGELLGLRGIDIFRVPAVPTSGPGVETAIPGERVTLAAARAGVSFTVRVPASPILGTPDLVYLDVSAGAERVTLVYRDRRGIPRSSVAGVSAIVVEFRGTVDEQLFAKAAGPGTRIERVNVNGGRGYWMEGEPHLFFYRDANGAIRDETLRLAGNTLLWEQDGVTLRLEANVTKDEALAIASSLR
ncbi:MAG TPA: hypothetical protein VFM06_07775 [Candidatus Limnocylindria bacterium]|nr:hypothetical protein [Candidatus Limnocylindria bacterium]